MDKNEVKQKFMKISFIFFVYAYQSLPHIGVAWGSLALLSTKTTRSRSVELQVLK